MSPFEMMSEISVLAGTAEPFIVRPHVLKTNHTSHVTGHWLYLPCSNNCSVTSTVLPLTSTVMRSMLSSSFMRHQFSALLAALPLVSDSFTLTGCT